MYILHKNYERIPGSSYNALSFLFYVDFGIKRSLGKGTGLYRSYIALHIYGEWSTFFKRTQFNLVSLNDLTILVVWFSLA
jgi:hypothetical protein